MCSCILQIIQLYMDSGRNFSHRSAQPKDPKLRLSSNFLTSELIRGSITPTLCCNIGFRKSNLDKIYDQSRISSLNKRHYSPINQTQSPTQSYAHLKDTLSQLQQKIKKAQQILSKTSKPLPQRSQPFFDYEQTISQIQSNITKKIDYTYNSVTQNSSKNLSFMKNSQSLQLPHDKIYLKKKNIYYIGNLYEANKDPRVQEHLMSSFKIFKTCSKFKAMPSPEFQDKWNLTLAPHHKDKKTILLDIDETILHCQQYPINGQIYDLQLEVPIGQNQHATAYISLRPYALTFLKNISKHFEIIAFTASHQSYADVVLNELDPDNEIFSHRLYRGSCQQLTQNIYAKDIRILNRKAQNMVLVDNSPYSYIFQLQNGIPILPYRYGADKQLPKLEKYLLELNKVNDVRQMNKQTFAFHRYKDFKDLKQLINSLYLISY